MQGGLPVSFRGLRRDARGCRFELLRFHGHRLPLSRGAIYPISDAKSGAGMRQELRIGPASNERLE